MPKDGPEISIVMAVFNGARFLEQQLSSVLQQVRRPEHMVISDDASVDASWEELQRFARTGLEAGIDIVLVRQASNLGVVANFSWALTRSRGDWVFLCDQDDRWYPDKLELMTQQLQRRPELTLLHCNGRRVDANGLGLAGDMFEVLRVEPNEVRQVAAGHAFGVYARRNLATGAAMAVRRDVVQYALPIPDGWIHDEWLAVCAAAMGPVAIMSQHLLDYRQHAGNQLGLRKRTWHDQWRHLTQSSTSALAAQGRRLLALAEWLREAPIPDREKRQHLHWLFGYRQHVMARQEMSDSRLRRLSAIWNELRSGNYHRYATGLRTLAHDLLRRESSKSHVP